MKKIVFIISFGLIGFISNAQTTLQGGDFSLTFRKSTEFNDETVAGSRYLKEEYQNTKVNKGTQDFLIRYNAYNDVMEYKNGADVLELIKDKNTHFIFQDGTVYELFTYNLDGKSHERYHQVLIDNKNSKISKFQSVKLLPAQKATNSYESDTQAAFKSNKEVYFLTYNGQTHEFDGKQKTLLKIIPSQSDAIKKFYKENRIRENDADMIKLGQFISTL